VLLQLGDDLLLVVDGQRRGGQDGLQLGVLLENVVQRLQRLGCRVEGGGFGGRGVLLSLLSASWTPTAV